MNTNLIARIEILENRIAPATIFAVDDANNLLSFDSATPGTVATKPIVGLSAPATEIIKGIDFRPATGQLYALGINVVVGLDNDEGRIYTIDPSTGLATQVGNSPFFSTFANGDDFGFDFNPVADRIRVVTDRDDNIRVNPNSGTLVFTDPALTPGTSALVGVAYDRNFEAAPATTLYGLDLNTDSLVRIGGFDGNPSPNGGVVTPIGVLGVDFGGNFKVGFDIESHTGTAYAIIRPLGGVTTVYTVSLQTGVATPLGPVGNNPSLNGMAVALPNDLTIVNALTAIYIDQDGDKVTIKITGAAPGASLNAQDFVFSTGEVGSQLKLLNFSDDGQEWAKASITITAVPFAGKGDSFATVGYINATGVDLGKVFVNGDLGQIDAGDPTTITPGLAGLVVQSMGVISISQLASGSSQTSDIVGRLGALTVKTDFSREQINVTGGVDGSIGPVFIGGDVIGTGLFIASGIKSTGAIASVKVMGSLLGGDVANIGSIVAGTSMGPVFFGGSIVGGTASGTGNVETLNGNMGPVTVRGSVIGGTSDHTGTVHAKGNMGPVIIFGSIIGGDAGAGVLDSGLVYSFLGTTNNIASIKVGGSLIGSTSDFSGIYSSGNIGPVTIGGSLQGGTGGQSGSIYAFGNLGAVKIGGDVNGGSGTYSGTVITTLNGNIASVTIGGSLTGQNTLTGIISNKQLGPVKISGSVRGDAPGEVRISAKGDLTATTTALTTAIKSLTVLGTVRNALILGGYDYFGAASNPDSAIGPVSVGGNWISSTLVAGTVRGVDNLYGTADDLKIAEGAADALFSKIAAVTIKGYALGTVGGTDNYGIVAEQVGPVKVGLRTYILAAGTDTTGFLLGTSSDFRVREV